MIASNTESEVMMDFVRQRWIFGQDKLLGVSVDLAQALAYIAQLLGQESLRLKGEGVERFLVLRRVNQQGTRGHRLHVSKFGANIQVNCI